jgi:hypothetical protein
MHIAVPIFTVPEYTFTFMAPHYIHYVGRSTSLPNEANFLILFRILLFCCKETSFFHPINPQLQKDGVPSTFTTHFFFFLFVSGPSAYASGSNLALIVPFPYWTFQLNPPVPRCNVP